MALRCTESFSLPPLIAAKITSLPVGINDETNFANPFFQLQKKLSLFRWLELGRNNRLPVPISLRTVCRPLPIAGTAGVGRCCVHQSPARPHGLPAAAPFPKQASDRSTADDTDAPPFSANKIVIRLLPSEPNASKLAADHRLAAGHGHFPKTAIISEKKRRITCHPGPAAQQNSTPVHFFFSTTLYRPLTTVLVRRLTCRWQ